MVLKCDGCGAFHSSYQGGGSWVCEYCDRHNQVQNPSPASTPAETAAEDVAEDKSPSRLTEGAVVWAEWTKNSWYHGRIESCTKGLFHVVFDDGDEGHREAGKIALDVCPVEGDLQVGTRVLAPWMFSLYPGVISQVKGKGRYGIQFDDGDTGKVKAEKLRLIGD